MIEKEPEMRRGGEVVVVVLLLVTMMASCATGAPTRRAEVTGAAGVSLSTSLKKLSSSLHPLFSFFFFFPPGDRLSYTAPSVTGIPSRFHGNEVRGGRSLLAVVCNHCGSCCVFVGPPPPPPPPPPLLTSATPLRAAERDPRGAKGPRLSRPRGQRCLQSVCLCVCVCVLTA